MIDSLIYAKLPPHLKRKLNLAYLENGAYKQNVAHLEKALELSGSENDGELTKPTMTAVPPNDNQQNTEQTKLVCHYCKEPGLVIRDCRKRMKKKQEQKKDPSIQNTKHLTTRSFAPRFHCQGTNHPPKKCWKCPNETNRPKRFKPDQPADNQNGGQKQGNLTYPGSISFPKNSLN